MLKQKHTLIISYCLTQTPVRELGDQLHVAGDGEDVQVVEEDVHHQDHSQVQQGLGGDVPHLPFLSR